MKISILILLLAVAYATALNLRENDIRPEIMPISKSGSGQTGRIFNGLKAQDGQFKFQVGLSVFTSATKMHWCGGSLLSPEWILTAAHCTDGVMSITAYIGSATKRQGTKAKVLEIINHENWNSDTLRNDISLLRIAPITLGSNIEVAKLPALSNSDDDDDYDSYLNEKVIASGWGVINDQGDTDGTLQYANMEVVPKSVCLKKFGATMRSTNICAKGFDKASTCTGDSGGPLVTESTRTLIGLTSFGSFHGCTLGFPEAFTRITSYRSWIKEKTGV